MALMRSPWIKVLAAGATGATLVVLSPIVFSQVLSLTTGDVADWPSMSALWRIWLAAAIVVGVAYWAHSPRGREVWTDEQRQGFRDLKNGEL